MDCPHCRTPSLGREDFCRSCGAYLSWEAPEPAGAEGPATGDPTGVLPPPTQTGAVDLVIEPDSLTVAPGDTVTARVTVQNNGTRVEDFSLRAEGPSWISLVPTTVKVFRGEQNTSDLQISPPREPSTPAGTFAVRVVCASEVNPGLSAGRSVRLQISPFHDFEVGITPPMSNGARRTVHRLALTNRGNQPVQVAIETSDSSGRLEFRHPPLVRVAPGQRADVGIAVLPTRKLFGQTESFRFDVQVAPGGGAPPTTVSAVRRVYPWLPAWAPPLAVVLVGLATVIALVFPGHKDAGTGATSTTGPSVTASSGGPSPTGSASGSGSPSGSVSGSGSPSTSDGSGSAGGPVLVPVLTGKTRAEATSLLQEKGLTIKTTTHADRQIPAGKVISSSPKGGATADPGSTVTVVVSTGLPAAIDLVGQAESAQWTDGTLATSLTVERDVDRDTCGYVALQSDLPLADGTSEPVVLETCPAAGQPGNVIQGTYTLPGPLTKGDRLTGRVGFPSGTTEGKVTFELWARTTRGDERVWSQPATGDQVLPVDVDLSGWAGATAVILRASDAGNGVDDRALWIGIQIVSEG